MSFGYARNGTTELTCYHAGLPQPNSGISAAMAYQSSDFKVSTPQGSFPGHEPGWFENLSLPGDRDG